MPYSQAQLRARIRNRAAARRRMVGKSRMMSFRRRGVNTSKVRAALGFPDRMITKLEYRTSGIYSVAATPGYIDYNLNSIYDPEIAVGGHQPLWTDQYEAVYNKYRVFRCKYEVKIMALSTGGTPARYVALASAQAPGVLPTNIGDAWEQNRTANQVLPSGPDRVTTVRGNIALPKLQGQTSVEFKGDDGNDALLTANPTNPAVLRTIIESVNGNETQYTYDIRLTYFVEFFDRKTPHVS